MRKIVKTDDFDWALREQVKSVLNLDRLPRFIIFETIEEEE